MKAVEIKRAGGPAVMELVDVPVPAVGDGQVLIEVKAASINPFDWKVRNGLFGDKLSLPFRLGTDLAGVVTAVGTSVTEFKIGDEVFGQALVLNGGSGAFAEQAVTKPSTLAIKPRSVNFAEAAALPLAGVSALQALTEHLQLQAGQKILITGGAGGIGSMAIALAKSIGAMVAVTVSSAEDAAYATARGADVVVNVTDQSLVALVHDYDAVFDTVGGEACKEAFRCLKPGGTIVSMLGKDDELAAQYQVTAIAQQTGTNTERLTKLAEWVDAESVKPHITLFPLAQVRQAFEAAESGQIQGKAVLEITGKEE